VDTRRYRATRLDTVGSFTLVVTKIPPPAYQ
jgi:hypothetical protein